MQSVITSGDNYNFAWFLINGNPVLESNHATSINDGYMQSTSGRVVTREASAEAEIAVSSPRMDGSYANIIYCAEFIPKM